MMAQLYRPGHSALILVDVINNLDYEGNEQILTQVAPLARRLRALCKAARKADMPIIYLNDNFGKWRSDFRQIIKACRDCKTKASKLAEFLAPEGDYFILKPMHSGFYGTPLQILLRAQKIEHLILTGIAADICVLYTANDAYMRGFELTVVSDAVASNTDKDKQDAIKKMRCLLKAQICTCAELISSLKMETR